MTVDATYEISLPNTTGKLRAISAYIYKLPGNISPTEVHHQGDRVVATDVNNDTVADTYTFRYDITPLFVLNTIAYN